MKFPQPVLEQSLGQLQAREILDKAKQVLKLQTILTNNQAKRKLIALQFLPNLCSGIKIIAAEEPGTAPALLIMRTELW